MNARTKFHGIPYRRNIYAWAKMVDRPMMPLEPVTSFAKKDKRSVISDTSCLLKVHCRKFTMHFFKVTKIRTLVYDIVSTNSTRHLTSARTKKHRLKEISSHTSHHQLAKHSSHTASHWGRQTTHVQETVMALHGRLLGASISEWAPVRPSQSSGHTHSCLVKCDFISLDYSL